MKTIARILLLSLCLAFSNCRDSNVTEKPGINAVKSDAEYDAFSEYLKSKNISLCELKEIRKKIIGDTQNLADEKYPNSIAQHDKFIERTTEREIDKIIQKYNLKTGDWSKARLYGEEYCD